MEKSNLFDIIIASNLFGRGFGHKKLSLIFKSYPDILKSKSSNKEKINMLISIEGIAEKSAQNFVEKIPNILEFITKAKLEYKLKELEQCEQSELCELMDKNHELFKKIIVFSGFRDKNLMHNIEKCGGIVEDSITKNTNILLVKDLDDNTTKTTQAKKYNIDIQLNTHFINKYNFT